MAWHMMRQACYNDTSRGLTAARHGACRAADRPACTEWMDQQGAKGRAASLPPAYGLTGADALFFVAVDTGIGGGGCRRGMMIS